MQYNLTDKIPEKFRWRLYFYFMWDLHLEFKIKKNPKKRFCDLIFDQMEKELEITTDENLKKWWELIKVIKELKEFFTDEMINDVLKDYECYDVAKISQDTTN
jgi:hypothetical protein